MTTKTNYEHLTLLLRLRAFVVRYNSHFVEHFPGIAKFQYIDNVVLGDCHTA